MKSHKQHAHICSAVEEGSEKTFLFVGVRGNGGIGEMEGRVGGGEKGQIMSHLGDSAGNILHTHYTMLLRKTIQYSEIIPIPHCNKFPDQSLLFSTLRMA